MIKSIKSIKNYRKQFNNYIISADSEDERVMLVDKIGIRSRIYLCGISDIKQFYKSFGEILEVDK